MFSEQLRSHLAAVLVGLRRGEMRPCPRRYARQTFLQARKLRGRAPGCRALRADTRLLHLAHRHPYCVEQGQRLQADGPSANPISEDWHSRAFLSVLRLYKSLLGQREAAIYWKMISGN